MRIKAIKIVQPLADFYLTKFKAKDLLKLCFSERLQYTDEKGRLKGSQRQVNIDRLREIGRYIDSVEMSFPTSIVLAANYNEEGDIIFDEETRWVIKEEKDDIYEIIIPKIAKQAAIIDGQHRLFAFEYISKMERLDIDIPCAIFFDLPNSYQAFLFATINGNQKSVSRSLALEQFGFNVEDEEKKSWTPEKFAVYTSRKLNFSETDKSVFFGKIKLAPIYNEDEFKDFLKKESIVSTAAIVDGILKLITKNPKRDRVEMGQINIFKGRNRKMLKDIQDNSPLREMFIDQKDDDIYRIIKSFFKNVDAILWKNHRDGDYLIKTVGIQALFEILKEILLREKGTIDFQSIEAFFKNKLELFKDIDFSDNFFTASGLGKSRIQNTMLLRLNYKSTDKIKNSNDVVNYTRILTKPSANN